MPAAICMYGGHGVAIARRKTPVVMGAALCELMNAERSENVNIRDVPKRQKL